MYKTVRHGENSLQYKILAQQEEGVANVKSRKSPRTVTTKLITVIILLIVGIIASAVLVPLVLTNDFIALTGTFQKFSVSTLRRSHSGNHVVVIAKKPYGWNPPHSSASPRLSNASQTHSTDAKKLILVSHTPPATGEFQTITRTTTTENLFNKITSFQSGRKPKPTEHPRTEGTAATLKNSGKVMGRGLMKPSSTSSILEEEKSFEKELADDERSSSTSEPVWFEPVKKWSFGSTDNFISGMNGVVTNPVSILGSFFFVVVVVIMFFVLKKTMPKRRNTTEKETADSKEDKTRLLSSSVSSDHDEE